MAAAGLGESSSCDNLTTILNDPTTATDANEKLIRSRSLPQWVNTSMKKIVDAERRLFQSVKSILRGHFVSVRFGQSRIWSVVANGEQGDRCPLVLVHGFAGGVGLWAQCIDGLATDRTVHAFDLLGFGRSSRPRFSSDATLVEMEWVQSIEDWRKTMKLEKMILLGHSLGGFLASSYALEYPERVRHLILVDPWGFPIRPPEEEREIALPTWVRTAASVLSFFNPLASVRAAGPWGPHLVRRFRPDLGRRFGGESGDSEAIYDYIYHCNAQKPRGEAAFKTLSIPFGWAKRPMIERLPLLEKEVPMTFVYGSKSWIDSGPGYHMQHELRPDAYVDVQMVKGAGHHVYADAPEEFCRVINDICDGVDSDIDQLKVDFF